MLLLDLIRVAIYIDGVLNGMLIRSRFSFFSTSDGGYLIKERGQKVYPKIETYVDTLLSSLRRPLNTDP